MTKIKTYKEYKELSIKKLIEKGKEFSFEKVDDRFHYIYRITNKITGIHYYGSKTSTSLDIGIKYFTTSSNLEFKKDFKNNTKNYKIKIVKIFDNKWDKQIYESFLHQYFNVKQHKKFYNKNNQLPTGRDTTNIVSCVDKDGNKQLVTKEEFYSRDDLQHHAINTVTCKDKNGNKLRVSKDEFDNNPNLIGITKGLFIAIDKDGNKFQISKDDLRYISGELVAESKGRKYTKEQNNNLKRLRAEKRQLFPEIEEQRKKNERETKINNGFIKIFAIYDNNDNLYDIFFGRLQLYCKNNKLPISPFYNSYKNNERILFKDNKGGNRTKAIKNNFIQYEGWYVKQLQRISLT